MRWAFATWLERSRRARNMLLLRCAISPSPSVAIATIMLRLAPPLFQTHPVPGVRVGPHAALHAVVGLVLRGAAGAGRQAHARAGRVPLPAEGHRAAKGVCAGTARAFCDPHAHRRLPHRRLSGQEARLASHCSTHPLSARLMARHVGVCLALQTRRCPHIDLAASCRRRLKPIHRRGHLPAALPRRLERQVRVAAAGPVARRPADARVEPVRAPEAGRARCHAAVGPSVGCKLRPGPGAARLGATPPCACCPAAGQAQA